MKVNEKKEVAHNQNDEGPSLIDIFRQSPVAIELYSQNGKLIDANQACLDLFGLDSVVVIKGFDLFEDPNLPEQAKLEIREGKSVRYEIRFDFELVKSRQLYQTSRSGVSFLECYITSSLDSNHEINGYIVNIWEITGKKEAEKRIHIQEETYQSIYNFISEAIFIHHPESGQILDVNDAMLKMYGYDSKLAALSCTLGDLSSNIDKYNQKTAQKYVRKACTKGPQTFEWQARRFDGTLFWVEMTLKETLIGGKMLILGVGRDITERKRSEEILRESENKYRSLIQYSSDPIFSFNPDYSYRFVNEAFARPFGKKPEDIIEKTPFDIFSPDEATKRLTAVRQVFQTGEQREIEVRVDTISGDIRYFLTMVDPIKNNSGQVLYVTCVSKDITARKRTEEALQKSEEKFRRIVETLTNGMYFYHLEENDRLIFMGANPAADRIIGITHQTIIGKTIEEAFPNLAVTRIPAMYKNIAKGELGSQEFEIEYKDELISGFYQVQVFQTEINTITVHFTEISARKNAEKLLEKQSAELQESNVTKDKFLSIIAHDLKNPFNAILGFSDLMLKNFYELDDETLLKGLTTIESASKHAYKLLENLLIWSQNQTGRREFNPESLNLKTQINESLSMVESTAAKKGIHIVLNIKKSIQIFADKNMIDSILRNLISNAIKFSHKGAKIRIAATESDHEIHISVSDDGVGMSPENLSSIFKIDKHTITLGTENEQGTGLGLILCKDFITRHNGKIWVESTPGKGSVFTFSLPSK